MNIVSIGEILWDVFEDAERLGGAPFNFAVQASRLGHQVRFVSAVGADDRGQRALDRVRKFSLSIDLIGRIEDQRTGCVTVSLDRQGQPGFTIHRPAAYDFVGLSQSQLQSIAAWRPDWLYFGTLHAMSPAAKKLIHSLIDANPKARRIYDVNLRPDSYKPELVRELMELATVAKINAEEAEEFGLMYGRPARSIEEFCRSYSQEFGWEAACVTRGAAGCTLLIGEEFVEADGYPIEVADTVGAGDAFAAAFVHGLANGWPASKVADFANRVGAIVATQPGALAEWSVEEVESLAL